MVKFNAHGPDGLIDRKAPGQPSRLNNEHRAAFAAILESGPIASDPRGRAMADRRSLPMAFRRVPRLVAQQTLSRELRQMGYRKLSARPRHHAQAEGAIEDFKKASPRAWAEIGRGQRRRSRRNRDLVRRRGAGRPEEQDHPPLGAARNTPSAPKDQRTASAYIFGAICPRDGKGAALVLPRCNTEAMNLHLAEIATEIAPGAMPSCWSIKLAGISPAA